MTGEMHALISDDLSPDDVYSSTPERPGEYLLAIAVLEQAFEDLVKHRYAGDARLRRAFTDAYKWLTSDDRCWPYSFLNICDVLDLPPRAVRSRFLDRSRSLPRVA